MALQQMRGGFSNELKDLREQLIHFASMIELELDFGEEDFYKCIYEYQNKERRFGKTSEQLDEKI